MWMALLLLLLIGAGIFLAHKTGLVPPQVTTALVVVIGLAGIVGVVIGALDWLLKRSRMRRDS